MVGFVLITVVFLVSFVEGAIIFSMTKGVEESVKPLVSTITLTSQTICGIGYVASIAAIVWGVLNLGWLPTIGALLIAGTIAVIYPGTRAVQRWWPAVPYLAVLKYVFVALLLDW